MRSLARGVFALPIALSAVATGLFIAAHHPLSPLAMFASCVAIFVICARFDHAWLLLLPALLPIVDLAPWTGWLTFEEFDVLVLGAAAGAWLRHGWVPGVSAPARPSKLLLVLVAFYLLFPPAAARHPGAKANLITNCSGATGDATAGILAEGRCR